MHLLHFLLAALWSLCVFGDLSTVIQTATSSVLPPETKLLAARAPTEQANSPMHLATLSNQVETYKYDDMAGRGQTVYIIDTGFEPSEEVRLR